MTLSGIAVLEAVITELLMVESPGDVFVSPLGDENSAECVVGSEWNSPDCKVDCWFGGVAVALSFEGVVPSEGVLLESVEGLVDCGGLESSAGNIVVSLVGTAVVSEKVAFVTSSLGTVCCGLVCPLRIGVSAVEDVSESLAMVLLTICTMGVVEDSTS